MGFVVFLEKSFTLAVENETGIGDKHKRHNKKTESWEAYK
jgi:hypothetical protein